MTRSRLLVALVIVAVATLSILPAAATASIAGFAISAAPAAPGATAPDRVVVRFRDPGAAAERARAHAAGVINGAGAANGSERSKSGQRGASVLRTTGQSVASLLAELRADPAVLWAEPDYLIGLPDDTVDTEPVPTGGGGGGTAAVGTDDPRLDEQYSLARMRIQDAWSIARGGNALVAVLDTGIQWTHPDLSGRNAINPGEYGSGKQSNGRDDDNNGLIDDWRGWDFVSHDNDPRDDNGHGTWVSGIIAAAADNGVGIAGISWTNPVLPVKVMNAGGTGYSSDLAFGIDYAVERGARVINLSVGGFGYSQLMSEAVLHAWQRGAVIVAAAGNERTSAPSFPAAYDHVVGVSATQADDEFTNWSNYGATVDVSAPGAAVTTTDCGGCSLSSAGTPGYAAISGTSFATPNTAGVVALLMARFPSDTNQQTINRLIASADDLGFPGWDSRYGHGRVNAFRALGGSPPAVEVPARDYFEPNDVLSGARRMTSGLRYAPTIYPAGDADLFALDAPRAGLVQFAVTPVIDGLRMPKSALPVDPIVEVFNAAGTRLVRMDHADPEVTEVVRVRATGAARFFVRITNWYPNGSTTPYAITGTFIDDIAPAVTALSPAPGAGLVTAYERFTFSFTEPVTGFDGTSVQLTDGAGTVHPSSVSYDAARRAAVVTPTAPLPASSRVYLQLSAAVVDLGGNPLTTRAWSMTTANGLVFAPARRVWLSAGSHTGYAVTGSGAIRASKTVVLLRESGAHVGQRSTLPGLPGYWLHVEDGIWAGMWVAESPTRRVLGGMPDRDLATTVSTVPGSHRIVRLDADAAVIQRRNVTLASATRSVDRRAIIDGRPYLRLAGGSYDGYWLAETAIAYRPGIVDRFDFGRQRRVIIAIGTHTGTIRAANGTVTGTKTDTLRTASGATATAYAVINGRPHLWIVNGTWTNTWLPADVVERFEW
ncbi:MAG: S8 family serine peptidase [Chloroflexota bacterium]